MTWWLYAFSQRINNLYTNFNNVLRTHDEDLPCADLQYDTTKGDCVLLNKES